MIAVVVVTRNDVKNILTNPSIANTKRDEKRKRRKEGDDKSDSSGEKYKLSNFFNHDSD
jgi:hypothetical protein